MTNTRIVVGDDGSKAAAVAIRHAATLAADLGVELQVVRAWTMRTAPRPDGFGMTVPSEEEFSGAVLAELTKDIAALELGDGAPITLRAIRGGSTSVLLSAGADARMLVVGSRGAGGFAGLRMGSTAEQVVRHASVPVLVVPVSETADQT